MCGSNGSAAPAVWVERTKRGYDRGRDATLEKKKLGRRLGNEISAVGSQHSKMILPAKASAGKQEGR